MDCFFWTFNIINGKVQKNGEVTTVQLRGASEDKRLLGTTSSRIF